MDTFVEETLDWQPITYADLPSLAELQSAIEYFDDPVNRIGIDELQHWFDSDPQISQNTICGRDQQVGEIVAYGWNIPQPCFGDTARMLLVGAVHPGWRDQRIGHSLVIWQLSRAKEWAEQLPMRPTKVWVGAHTDMQNSGSYRLFHDHGLIPERYFFDMHHIFARVKNPPPPPPVEGIRFVGYKDEYSEEVRQLHNRCFEHKPGFQPVSEAHWQIAQQRSEFRPDWSWIAFDGNQIVGYALNSADETLWPELGFTEGWTDRLGVDPHYRRRGIAKGLLSWSMWSFGQAGLDGAGLGIDTADAEAAISVYQGIGYESADMVVLLSKTIVLHTG